MEDYGLENDRLIDRVVFLEAQLGGTPQTDPEWSEIARKLGEANQELGRSNYANPAVRAFLSS